MNRDEIALKALLALMPVYWDTVDEYESADDLIRCHFETAFEYADEFLKRKEMTSLKQKVAKYGERKTSDRFPSWIADEAYKIVDVVEELRFKIMDEISDDVRDDPSVIEFRVKLDILRRFAWDTADSAINAEALTYDEGNHE